MKKQVTKQLTLAAGFAALDIVTKPLGVYVVPGVALRISALFTYLAVLALPWPFTMALTLLGVYAADNVIKNIASFLVGTQVVYFVGRRLPVKWKALAVVAGTYPANIAVAAVNSLMGIGPFWVQLPAVIVKASVIAVVALLIGPPVILMMKRLGFFNDEKS